MEQQEPTIEIGDDQDGTLGQIKVNHTVVATIVKMAATSVKGVVGVGGSFIENVSALFSSKDYDKGVRVSEDEGGNYLIELRVHMEYGVELAKTAENLQLIVGKQVTNMTGKTVGAVDVVIEGVKMPEEVEAAKKSADSENATLSE
ncbi:Asp23/Gls24 family envelope stress response protein [Pelagicoccus mobilis]|uniref:Asp23/Gls24 family envelope stress response protein n=1 Tax=Pelagicoccus mobilis TaxID=415221 RepID=A0A934VRS8_9BACT|nr:Asp23/Gls24 family envelope stress response protein [Pelagicoccus mobilis]MBK1877928.1 Asp23/Gls24 family envelope stress response protein [Pelagicoccus mobilis]